MKRPLPSSVFLERRSYRRRRMMDAVRLLPIFAALLFMLPLFWPTAPDTPEVPVSMSTAVIYVFLVWLMLICAAYGLWSILWSARPVDVPDPDDSDDGEVA
ncbi:hypothetical protein [uncultured Tateyamaria sp.]|uniref:hypothetical protein n=1 Tax=Tateyamaria sp. 1078 TaxID=3417464 RepID=UPI002603802E|nr:hypothetical protein [uncultured Tateyamaria sp.]